MHITFVTSGLTFNGDSLKQGALGGSETALISMAAAFRARGHRVRVFCQCDAPGEYDGVLYFDRSTFEAQAEKVPTDVLIASRWAEPLMCPSTAGIRVLWLHDIAPPRDEFVGKLYQTDMLFGLSDYHIDDYCRQMPELRKMFWRTENGVDKGLIEGNVCEKVPGKLIYTSRPERGLRYLLQMMPAIVKAHPNARLHVATYSLQNMQMGSDVAAIHAQCDEMIDRLGDRVVRLGSLTKASLYRHISSAELMLYPTDFPEISCITAMEAQACGTPIITSDAFALKETVLPGYGVLVVGDPRSDAYRAAFLRETNLLLADNPRRVAMSDSARKDYLAKGQHTWAGIAASWEKKFEEFYANRSQDAIFKRMEKAGDTMPLSLLTKTPILDSSPCSYEPSFSEAADLWKTTLDVYMAGASRIPQSVLDLSYESPYFGIYAAKALPNARVTVMTTSEDFADVQEFVKEQGLVNLEVLAEGSEISHSYETVFIGRRLESRGNPQTVFESACRYLLPGGKVLGTTRWNMSEHGGVLWNFDYEDLREIFADAKMDAGFTEVGRTSDGRISGFWSWSVPACTPRKIDLRGRLRRMRPYKSLALCMIVKNEEDWISGCLKSALPFVDEIHIANTGSVDSTNSIIHDVAPDANVKMVAFDNFSQARNASMEGVNTDWIMVLDADERIASGENIRKYLESTLFEGLSVAQVHLTSDGRSEDRPIRIFKNRPHYKFTGLIHEHCEDISEQPYDKEIYPALYIDDFSIMHFGYSTERLRRRKCSDRNIGLLIRDVKESPGRMLTWILVMRDYFNIVQWGMKPRRKIENGSREHQLLNAIVATYHNKFWDGTSRYAALAEDLYQSALKMLGRHELPALDFEAPPFEAKMSLMAAYGGLSGEEPAMRTRWFVCTEELQCYVSQKSSELSDRLTFAEPSIQPRFGIPCELPDPTSLLSHAKRSGVSGMLL